MTEMGLPPGFRFHPTDEEIVTHYLTPKALNPTAFTATAIGEADLNKSEPWDLPKKAKMGEKEWFFFCQRDRKYPTGMRTNRATESGYWKATGKDKEIFEKMKKTLVGMKKTLVFYRGRAPRGEKTNWVMHEFRLEGKFSYCNTQDEWVVCRVFHKTTGDQNNNPAAEHHLHGSKLILDTPSLLDPSPMPESSYFSPQLEDYKNIHLLSSYDYNFNTNTFQPDFNPCYGSNTNTGLKNLEMKENHDHVVGRCQMKVEHYMIPTSNRSQDTGVSSEMTTMYPETSSTSMLSKHGLSRRLEYDMDNDDGDDDVGPSTFSDLDSLLEY